MKMYQLQRHKGGELQSVLQVQKFGHSYGKYILTYLTEDSTKQEITINQPERYANWGGPHPADYRKYEKCSKKKD